MVKFDHLRIPVSDLTRSRRWYIDALGLKVEFELPDRQTVALQDSAVWPNGCALWFQVADVDATFAESVDRGIEFAHGPRKTYWGYGAELSDPDGYLIRLWDERTMKEK